MSSFEMGPESVIDVLIYWIAGADGHIEYDETESVKEALDTLSYDPEDYFHDTMTHINGLSTESINELIENAIDWAKEHFDHHKMQSTVALLEYVAESDDKISKSEQEKIDRLRDEFGL
jgi:tellurite resistance protein